MTKVSDVVKFGANLIEQVGATAYEGAYSLALQAVSEIGMPGSSSENYADDIREAFPKCTTDQEIRDIANTSIAVAEAHFDGEIKVALQFLERFGNDPAVAGEGFIESFENGELGQFIEEKGGAQVILAESAGIDPIQAKIDNVSGIADLFDDIEPTHSMTNALGAFDIPANVSQTVAHTDDLYRCFAADNQNAMDAYRNFPKQ